ADRAPSSSRASRTPSGRTTRSATSPRFRPVPSKPSYPRGGAKSLHVPREAPLELGLGDRATDLLDLAPAVKDDHRRNRRDGEARRQPRVLVDVELRDLQLPAPLARQLIED